jgi:hypothetical protein
LTGGEDDDEEEEEEDEKSLPGLVRGHDRFPSVLPSSSTSSTFPEQQRSSHELGFELPGIAELSRRLIDVSRGMD